MSTNGVRRPNRADPTHQPPRAVHGVEPQAPGRHAYSIKPMQQRQAGDATEVIRRRAYARLSIQHILSIHSHSRPRIALDQAEPLTLFDALQYMLHCDGSRADLDTQGTSD